MGVGKGPIIPENTAVKYKNIFDESEADKFNNDNLLKAFLFPEK